MIPVTRETVVAAAHAEAPTVTVTTKTTTAAKVATETAAIAAPEIPVTEAVATLKAMTKTPGLMSSALLHRVNTPQLS
jgi:hypothetical protein